jgi:serine/threonine protein kinase
MSVTITEFLDRLIAGRLFDDADLDKIRQEVADEEGSSSAERLAKRLVKDKRLTAYQARLLWTGKTKGLSLGNYIVEDELGRGGMGVVLKARHRVMNRTVAVKVLPGSVTKNKSAVLRFQREVVAAAQLTHPNIVGALDADEIDGTHVFVMQFVDGRDLSVVVKKNGPLGVEQAIDCIVQAARGLKYAHDRGVIHRDIKPANLLLNSSGTVKILDMGLARFSGSADVGDQAELTGTGMIMGTVDYMSPEQALNTKTADERSDIYSLGISLFYLLIGKPAYLAESLMGRMLAHRESPIPVLSQIHSDVSQSLDAVFTKMVAKTADQRYQTMTEVIADLEVCRSGGTVTLMTAAAPVTGPESSSDLSNFLQTLDTDSGTVRAVATAARPQIRQQLASETLSDSAGQDTHSSKFQPAHLVDTIKSKQNRMVVIGGGVGCVLLLGLLAWAFSGGEEPPKKKKKKSNSTSVAKSEPVDMPRFDLDPFWDMRADTFQPVSGGGVSVLISGEGNLAAGRPTEASSEKTGKNNFASKAVDRNLKTRWCARDNQPGSWWQVDFGSPKHIKSLRIHWEKSNAVYRYLVESSSDGVMWETLVDQSMNDTVSSIRPHNVDARETRFVRVTYLGSPDSSWGSFWEFEAYEGTLPDLP